MQGLTLANGMTFGMEDASYASDSTAPPANPLSTERELPSLTARTYLLQPETPGRNVRHEHGPISFR